MWLYQGKPFTEEQVQQYMGFVYLITDHTNNKLYVGKKLFTKSSRKQVKGKRKKIRKQSDWLTYFGSNKALQEQVKRFGPEKFTREIIRLCKTRSECSYYETKEILVRDALLRNDYYNDWISAKITRKHLAGLQK